MDTNTAGRKFRCLYELTLGACTIAPDEIVYEDDSFEQSPPPGAVAITHIKDGIPCFHTVSRRALKPIN